MSENNKGSFRKFTVKMQKKLVLLYGLLVLAFAGLIVRLVWISKEDGEKYSRQVLSQQRYDSTTIPYKRGDIVDARGIKLATSEKVYNLVIDAKLMLNNEESLEPTLQALSDYFGLDQAVIRSYVQENPNSSYYRPSSTRKMSYDQISGFEKAMSENNLIQGVWFEPEYKRLYPQNTLACDVIGFSGADNNGSYGLEEYYNDVLNGTTGREYGYLTEDATLERTVKAAVDGNTIHTTIDSNIQAIVEKYLKQFNDEFTNQVREGNGAENLGAVIMEVDTGRILAMASYPVYDLNNVQDPTPMIGSFMVEQTTNANGYTVINKTDTVINQAVIESMTEEQKYLNLNNLWKNYCITNTYEPGSTIKPFTVAAGLESGVITGNEVYNCTGSLLRGGFTIKCHGGHGHGAVTVQNSIAWSCNVALMKIGEALGAQNFGKFQEIFNFGLKTNVDLAGEARTAGLLFPADQMKEADLATNSFGQNFNVTMIQMIAGYSALINGGYYYEPHMVDKVTNSAGATVQSIEPRILKQVVSEETSEKLRSYTRATVMEEGGDQRTGKTARPAGYAIGGKTGTAETLPRGNREYVVSFMGHAPADDPKVAIYVVVDRANATRQDDAKYATKIVRNILSEVLPYLNIFMTEELSESEITELQERQLAITNQYAANTGEDAETSDTEETGDNGKTGENTEENNSEVDPIPWKNYPVDPDTGYLKDPSTGDLLDPTTGEIIQGNPDSIPQGAEDPLPENPQEGGVGDNPG